MSLKRVVMLACLPLLSLAALSPARAQDAIDGQAVFVGTCAGCHGAVGEGGYGPPLADYTATAGVIGDIEAFVRRIVLGGELMPPFGHLSDAEIAAIINFVRTELNAHTDLVDATAVAGLRP